ncbi:GerAB/ArcD/ProY family transporter [Gordoniibacillus kamchatkensis]|nr:GerAB/ArcD/ProY family transporter [Paenibacillus sp. VKM B-2647]
MLVNTIIYVPNILFAHRHNSALTGMLLSVVIGSCLAVIFSKAMMNKQGQGLPELLTQHLPLWIKGVVLIYLGFMWFAAGSIVLIVYSIILKRFIIEDINLEVLIILLMSVVVWSASKPTKTILYLLEIVMVINVPLVSIILFKALSSKYMNWYGIWNIASDNVMKLPNLDVVAAATYLFTGYINQAIFNREFDGRFCPKHLWAIPFLGLTILSTTFFIPIGFHGTEGVGHFVYPWVSTADSLRMEFGFVERVVYLFLLLYLSLTLIFVTVTWHVGYRLIESISQKQFPIRSWSLKPIVVFGSFMLITIFLAYFLNEKQHLILGTYWLRLRFWSELGLVLYVYYLSRKGKTT